MTLALLPLGLMLSAGCASSKSVVLHPIEKSDIFSVTKDTEFKAEKNGWFVSDFYLEEVMKAKVN